jgi:hypothetical protein
MSRRQIEHAYYQFIPSQDKIIIPRIVRQDRLMLITNTTAGKVIYNFSDPNLTAYDFEVDNTISYEPKTIITLKYNCSGMSPDDSLAIIVDEAAETVTFTEPLMDAVNKLRVSPPQSLMDTDFEYGVQGSKWEALTLASNYPSFFSRATGGNSFDLVSIVGDGVSPRSTVEVIVSSPATELLPGDIISVQDTLNPLSEGTFPVLSVGEDGYSFTYLADGVVDGSLSDGSLTSISGGGIYDNAHIPGGNNAQGLQGWTANSDGAPESVITITTSTAHGLLPGTPILVGSQNPACQIKGAWRIFNVSSPNSMKFKVNYQVTNPVITAGVGLYAKPNGYVQHRPHDGGVILSTTDNVCGVRVIRQTRRNFRYQSGKSIQFSTGVKFTPTFDVNQISVAGVLQGNQVVTVTTIQDHGMQPGALIRIEGVETAGSYNPWNGDFTVTNVLGTNSFQYIMPLSQNLTATDQFPGGIDVTVTVYRWEGAATRTGMFNDQNGFFFEYDGRYVYAVRRFTKKELFGKIAVTKFSNTIVGDGTRFRKQLQVGDSIVIKGANYNVIEIASDTNLKISPAYKGESNSTARYLITQEIRVPQTEWNMDRMDGEGPSGYTLDPTKMQMAYIDYTWYGAGFIRFGFRTTEGNIFYCHKMANNNRNTEAYMRSGNLPARYEAINSPFFSTVLKAGSTGIVGSALNPTEIIMYVDSVKYWPEFGYLIIKDNENLELCSYTITNTAYNEIAQGYPVNINRRQPMTSYLQGQAVQLTGTSNSATFLPDNTITNGLGVAQVSVQTITNTCAPVISHWGSSVIMDGKFDDDKNFIFTAGMQKFVNVQGSGEVITKISSKSASGGTATLTTPTNHQVQVGYPLTVSDVKTNAIVSSIQRTTNTSVTFNTTGNHNFAVGQDVDISGVVFTNRNINNQQVSGANLLIGNGIRTIQTVPTPTSFTLQIAGIYGYYYPFANINQTFGGVAALPQTNALSTESTTFNGTFTVSAVTSNTIQYSIPFSGTVPSSIISPNGSASQTFGTKAIPRPLLSIRVAPSADNGIGRNYGKRETLNTMQLALSSLGILAQGAFLIQGIYNPSSFPTGVNIPNDWENIRVPGGSLAQVIYHDNTGTPGSTVTSPITTVSGGDQAFAFYTDGTGGQNYSSTTFDLSKVKDLGTSILSGDGNNAAPSYPNGPDVLTIVATNLGLTSGDITARLSWTEAQA